MAAVNGGWQASVLVCVRPCKWNMEPQHVPKDPYSIRRDYAWDVFDKKASFQMPYLRLRAPFALKHHSFERNWQISGCSKTADNAPVNVAQIYAFEQTTPMEVKPSTLLVGSDMI